MSEQTTAGQMYAESRFKGCLKVLPLTTAQAALFKQELAWAFRAGQLQSQTALKNSLKAVQDHLKAGQSKHPSHSRAYAYGDGAIDAYNNVVEYLESSKTPPNGANTAKGQ